MEKLIVKSIDEMYDFIKGRGPDKKPRKKKGDQKKTKEWIAEQERANQAVERKLQSYRH